MGIFDEAIREHLELKRQHGAGASELKQLEDEAFGPPERPGSEEAMPEELAEAPTEFIAQPETAEISTAEPAPEQELAEAEPEATEEKQPEVAEKAPARRESAAEIADLQEGPQPGPEEPSAEERQAIAEQPTELYDMEEELAASVPAPSEEELIEEEIGEPRLAPVDPLSGLEHSGDVEAGAEDTGAAAAETDGGDEEEDDDFFDEQRLSDELDQALEAPSEVDEEEQEGWEPEEQELDQEEPALPGSEEDLLEETPDFLEEAPEADRLWFEQKPPKDFDFDD